MPPTDTTPSQQWEALRQEIVKRADEIDKQTPWSEKEPTWWLQMQEIRRCASVPTSTNTNES